MTTEVHPARTEHHSVRDRVVSAARVLLPTALVLWLVLFGVGHLITSMGPQSSALGFDRTVEHDLARDRTSGWNTITHYLTDGAETLTVISIGLIAAIVLRLLLRRWREPLLLATGLIGEVTIFVLTTLVVGRARPDVPHLDNAPPTSSFPSGHTSAAIVLYGGLALILWHLSRNVAVRIGGAVLAVGMPVAVGVSRMYRGMHFPTDVIAGAILGTVWLAVCARTILWRDE